MMLPSFCDLAGRRKKETLSMVKVITCRYTNLCGIFVCNSIDSGLIVVSTADYAALGQIVVSYLRL